MPKLRLFKGQRLDYPLQRLQIALDHPRIALKLSITHAVLPEQRERHQTARAVWYHPHRIVECPAVRQRDHMVQHAERIGGREFNFHLAEVRVDDPFAVDLGDGLDEGGRPLRHVGRVGGEGVDAGGGGGDGRDDKLRVQLEFNLR